MYFVHYAQYLNNRSLENIMHRYYFHVIILISEYGINMQYMKIIRILFESTGYCSRRRAESFSSFEGSSWSDCAIPCCFATEIFADAEYHLGREELDYHIPIANRLFESVFTSQTSSSFWLMQRITFRKLLKDMKTNFTLWHGRWLNEI